MKKLFTICALLLFIGIFCFLNAGMKRLTFEQVYLDEGEKIVGELPGDEEWNESNSFLIKEDNKIYRIAANNGKKTVALDPAEYADLLGVDFDLLDPAHRSHDLQSFLFLKDDDIYLFSRSQNKLQQLTKTAGPEKNPRFSPNRKYIAYTLDGNLYVYDLGTKKHLQITSDGSNEILNGESSYVYHEEVIGRRQHYKAFWWSPNSDKIVFMRFNQAKVPLFPIFRSKGIYGELEEQRYPKAGYPNPTVQIGIADVGKAQQGQKQKSAIEWIPFPDAKDHYLAFPTWNQSSSKIFFQWLNRDQNHLKILAYDTRTKKIQQLYEEHQKTWIDFLEEGDSYFLKNGDFIIRSSKDGWYHLYLFTKDGRESQLTNGQWSVSRIEYVDENRGIIYFSAQKEDSTQTHCYRVTWKNKKIHRLTTETGNHQVRISPRGEFFIDIHSSINRPPRMDLRNIKGKLIRTIADTYCPSSKQYQLATVELFRIPTSDGIQLPAVWLLPPGLDKKGNRKYPVVFTIYGGPGAASVRNRFPRVGRFFTAQHDIIVISVDHRGSSHFGKKGMDLMHRCLGKWEMLDYIECVKYLRQLPFVDGQKIGITGGSYGGYVSALAVTKYPGYFQYGIAGASVIDWRLYDSIYTERYMDTPQDNQGGYDKASVLSYIDSYRSGSLRVDHGMMDDNVHMQNTIQFVDRVIRAGKRLEVMYYPGQRHGYRGETRNDVARADLDFWLRKFYPCQQLQ